MNVTARNMIVLSFAAILFAISFATLDVSANTQLNVPTNFTLHNTTNIKKTRVGMNLPAINYHEPFLMFNDIMKTADFRADVKGSGWDASKFLLFPKDSNGYPTTVPLNVDGINYTYIFLVNSWYAGEYVLLYDGEGTVSIFNAPSFTVNGRIHLILPGIKANIAGVVTSVNPSNHIRNIRMIPIEYLGREHEMPVFRDKTITALRHFHSLRFMDFTQTNGSPASEWSYRTKIDGISQSTPQGVAWEYVIALANQLQSDPWICIPHKASDDYIISLANLFKSNLNTDRKLYIEFSNELWNWPFSQATYVNNNAPDHPNTYVSTDLAAIGASGGNFPEKDAYMMARTFRLFDQVWGTQKSRIVHVATGQHAWAANSGRILNYLFETDGIGADALAVGGYFYFNPSDHAIWNAMDPANVTSAMILESAENYYDASTGTWITATKSIAQQYGVDYLVYEGGQHMQPYNQGEWGYNHAVYDAQVHPGMYDLYIKNFLKHQDVDCKLFMAFSFVGARESRYGSWGHLESLNQLNSPETLMSTAPKYKALLDINADR